MIRSMTGFGGLKEEIGNLEVSVEIKSLNSKFLDLNLRLPKEYTDKEFEIRTLISNTLERGKIGFSLDVQEVAEVKAKVTINRELVRIYYQDLLETAAYVGASDQDLFKIALQMPKAINQDTDKADNQEEWKKIVSVIEKAIKECDNFRLKEGHELSLKLEGYISRIKDLLRKIQDQDPARIAMIREKIKGHFLEFANENVDQNRFEQELIYYIEKLDITEEKVRLKSHLDYFLEILRTEKSGKKLGFISQEIGREINTIGSKANDATIQKLVVEMKEELEKIKEQSLNIL
ncbi:MAG: YicC/YloC family endoribonuclease [Cytophagaceae bacterium]